jgi:hypothetical protein
LHHFSSYPQRKRCSKNAFSVSENAENDHFNQVVGIKNFEVIYEEHVMAQIQKHKTQFLNINIETFFLLSSEKEMLIKRVQDVGIHNFEVIYEEHVMAHNQNNTNHDLET